MSSKGIDHATCPKARVVRSRFSGPERASADGLMRSFKPNRVKVFIQVGVLDVIELVDEPVRRRLFWRDILGDKHFDYVVCRRETLEPPLAVELDDPRVPRRSTTADDVKSTAARRAGFPVARFTAGSPLMPDLVRQTLIAAHGSLHKSVGVDSIAS